MSIDDKEKHKRGKGYWECWGPGRDFAILNSEVMESFCKVTFEFWRRQRASQAEGKGQMQRP